MPKLRNHKRDKDIIKTVNRATNKADRSDAIFQMQKRYGLSRSMIYHILSNHG